VVNEGSIIELPKLPGAKVSFVSVATRTSDGAVFVASVHALVDRIAVGSIKWAARGNGEITNVIVRRDFQRRGIGTILFEIATQVAEEQGWTAPVHSDERTEAGDGWAQSLGATPAKEILPPRDS